MTGMTVNTASSPMPSSLAQETREGIAQGIKHGWEATAFDGLFERHLGRSAGFTAPPADALVPAGHDVGTIEDEIVPRQPGSQQRGGGPMANGRPSLAPADPPVAAQGWSVLANAGAAATGAPEYSGDDAQAANVDAASRDAQPIDAPTPEQVVVSVVGEEGTEIYVRDNTLDGNAGGALGRAIRELLERHRLTLGRVKLNGHELAGDGESGS